MKAILTFEFELAELYNGELPYDGDGIVTWKEGSEVEIIREVRPHSEHNSGRCFIIYSEELNESTVVSKQHLKGDF